MPMMSEKSCYYRYTSGNLAALNAKARHLAITVPTNIATAPNKGLQAQSIQANFDALRQNEVLFAGFLTLASVKMVGMCTKAFWGVPSPLPRKQGGRPGFLDNIGLHVSAKFTSEPKPELLKRSTGYEAVVR